MVRFHLGWSLCLLAMTAGAMFHAVGCAVVRGNDGAGHVAGASTDEPLGWLAGSWRCVNAAGTWDEHWYEPVDGTIAGSLRWTRPDGTLALLELFSIEHASLEPGEPARAVLFLRHFNAGLEPWAGEREATPRYTIEVADERELVAVSFPDQLTRIRYRRDPGDRDALIAEVAKRPALDAEWSTRVYLAFERRSRR